MPLTQIQRPTSKLESTDQSKRSESIEDIPDIQELFAYTETSTPNRNVDFYQILAKRYAQDIHHGIQQNFSKPDGESALKQETKKEKLTNLFNGAIKNGCLPTDYNLSKFDYAVMEGMVEYKEYDGVPVLLVSDMIFDEGEEPDFGAVTIVDKGKLLGIIQIKEEGQHGKILDKINLRHEMVHVANKFLKEKLNLTEPDPDKRKYLWSFIDEFLAYGANLIRETNAEEVCRYMFYIDPEDEHYLSISEKWADVLNNCHKDALNGIGSMRNKVKAYLIQKAKNFADIDLTNPETEKKFNSFIGT